MNPAPFAITWPIVDYGDIWRHSGAYSRVSFRILQLQVYQPCKSNHCNCDLSRTLIWGASYIHTHDTMLGTGTTVVLWCALFRMIFCVGVCVLIIRILDRELRDKLATVETNCIRLRWIWPTFNVNSINHRWRITVSTQCGKKSKRERHTTS